MKKDAHNRAPNASMIPTKHIFMVSYFTLNVNRKTKKIIDRKGKVWTKQEND